MACRNTASVALLLALLTALLLSSPAAAARDTCAKLVSPGDLPTASDCLFILNAVVGTAVCEEPCMCAPKGSLPPTASDALLCLNAATGQQVELRCPCDVTTTTSTTTSSTSTTTLAPTTTLPPTTLPPTTTSTTTSSTLASSTTSSTTTTTVPASCQTSGEGRNVEGITAAHNEVRADPTPTPDPPLAPLCWSESVASVAASWASNCKWGHNPNRGFLGENIYAGSGDRSGYGALQAVTLWAAEASSYDYESNTCSGVCGHYTQIVWRRSEDLGCALAVCRKNSPFGSGAWTYVVCNYSPPGNYIGQRPY